jgi:hypothetical protein
MATPSEIRDQLLKDLRLTRDKLMSPGWLMLIRTAPDDQKAQNSEQLFKVQLAIMDLENEALADFRSALRENEEALADSTATLRSTLEELKSTETVLKAVTSFIGIVARVVALV